MSRLVYSLVLRLLAPLIWLWMWRRAKRAGGDWQIFSTGRFGHDPSEHRRPASERPVWVHAVSLGETRAAQPLVMGLLARGLPVLLTHTTATGKTEGARLFADAISKGQLRQRWLPYDFSGSVRRFFDAYHPRLGVLIEREVWPNLLAAARRSSVPMALVSARFSESSRRQARWLGGAVRQALDGLDVVLAQTPADAERLIRAGAKHTVVAGNLKFDAGLPEAIVAAGRQWKQSLGRPVIAIASTREGEEAQFIALISERLAAGDSSTPTTRPPLYLLIPRHPQRFAEVADLLDDAGLHYVRRSRVSNTALPDTMQVFLGDTLGEMPFFYGASDVAIIGGSFAKLGGQNLMEACAAGVPVIMGPHTFNFAQAAEDAITAGGALRMSNAREAFDAAHLLLIDVQKREKMAAAGKLWTTQHAGATNRILDALSAYLAEKNV
jgi:3-deoxy-D-manno-octulosonic-acid transferase